MIRWIDAPRDCTLCCRVLPAAGGAQRGAAPTDHSTVKRFVAVTLGGPGGWGGGARRQLGNARAQSIDRVNGQNRSGQRHSGRDVTRFHRPALDPPAPCQCRFSVDHSYPGPRYCLPGALDGPLERLRGARSRDGGDGGPPARHTAASNSGGIIYWCKVCEGLSASIWGVI